MAQDPWTVVSRTPAKDEWKVVSQQPASSGGIPESRKGTRYDFLPPTSMVRQAGNMFDVFRDAMASTADKPSAQMGHAVMDPFLDIISGVKRGTEDLTQGLPALFGLPGARDYKSQKEAQYQNVTQNRLAAAVPRVATQAAITYPVGGVAGNVVRAVAPALKVAPSVVKAATTALETGGFKAPNVLAKVAGGGTVGAGGAVLTDQDVGLSTLIGGALPVVAPAAGKFILDIFDKVTGSAGAARAADMMRQALGDKWQQALQVLKSAPDNLTATQALQEAGIEAPIFASMGRDIEKGLAAPELMPLFEQQAQARTNVLAAQAGGPTQTAALVSQDAAKANLNALTGPMRQEALDTANIGGRYIPNLQAQAGRLEGQAATDVETVRRMEGLAPRARVEGQNFKPVPGMPRVTGPMIRLEQVAKDQSERSAAESLVAGKAARDANQIASNIAEAGLNPIDTNALTSRLVRVQNDPQYAGNDKVNQSVRAIMSDVSDWATKNGGVIDAEALYGIRKNTVSDTIDRLMAGSDPSSKRKAAAAVMAKINPLIDDAIEAAGGKGWRDYLNAYSTGMKDVERRQLSAKAMQMLKDSPNEFVKLVRGDNPDAIENIFGPGSYDIVKEMGAQMGPSRLPGLQKVAGELERGARIDELATVGRERAVEILKETRGIPSRVLSFLTRSNPKLNAASSFADALLEIRLAPKTQAALVDGFKSGKSAAELLAIVPTKDRLAASKLFNNPSFWRSSAAVTTNALAPANANTNALAQ